MKFIHPHMPVTVLDFETTGLSPKNGDRVIEVGAVKVRGGRPAQTYQSLVYYTDRLSPRITNLTGIRPWELQKAPPAEAVFQQLLDFLGSDLIVCHNAAFEKRFFASELERTRLNTRQLKFACTLKLARKYLPHAPNYRLETLIKILQVPMRKPLHRACNDALATVPLWLLLSTLSAEANGVAAT